MILRKININNALSIAIFISLIFGNSASGSPETEPKLKVGIVQRFGNENTDIINLQSTSGDTLTLKFLAGNMEPQTVQAKSVKVEMVMQQLPKPIVEERLVLSNHATFETAEDAANQWKAKGIEVEITQPERWQVWAKRNVYPSPLVRRLLLQNIQSQGHKNVRLETQVLPQVKRISFAIDGFRYTRGWLEISAGKNLIQVSQGADNKNVRLYGGSLRLQANAYGTYTLVNQVPIETYLRGVVPHEIGPGAPYSAVEAQTILARTYALRNLRRFVADNYEICADTHCQVYKGLTGTVARADQAIAATNGMVLTYNNELVDALYAATSGGVTSPFSDTWNGVDRPYLKAVVDSPNPIWNLSQKSLADEENFREFINLKEGFNESGRDLFRWRRENTLEQITADLQRYLTRTQNPLASFTKIVRMQVVERSPSGRILTLKVQTDKGVVELHKNEVRSAFTPPISTLFYLDPIYDEAKTLKGYAFVGGGMGHGVGLSQYGSYNLAQIGWSGAQILNFYYPGTEIKPLDNSIVFWREPEPAVKAQPSILDRLFKK
ncbi:MAG TPA: amidase [Cyanobacteria bacterium UBA11149]|nr:amidase [Cyanobacteria bacterium UBA11367]HBE58174.1 amidase [Cyanobacteria bacterium UBA11366]HBK63923.1 amidase [Cyanobacteria bacterium UBA11166]HBR73876.1 amidase [Cyanobacteria bacterium UBA11159]HBS68241.1 amidase [Cyanobacteria bacterium UBA11153]HBW92455.1 amidase [Cyanobacteria bacterium UBA11149]HCA93107.1 amidase [Cyanobacteria bacterium UBA9226]